MFRFFGAWRHGLAALGTRSLGAGRRGKPAGLNSPDMGERIRARYAAAKNESEPRRTHDDGALDDWRDAWRATR